ITKEDIWDILHFSHYSKLAYVEIDPNRNFDLLLSRSAKNDLFHSPFMISFDHDWKAIVIAIRGTNSAVDVLVDLKIDLAPLETGTPFMAHSGMLETARNIVRKLLDENFLETYRSDEYKNYRIVVCGHSLGAGVAALVGYYLRKKHASVRVYAYEAPGGLLNESGASLFDDFCVTVVCGDDLVPRLSRYCMDLLKADLIRILKNCQEPKYKIIHSVIGNLFKVSEKTKAIIGKDPEAAKRNMEKIQKETSSLPQSWRGEQTAQHVSQATPTFMPGRILYLEKLREFDRSERDDQAKEPSKQRKGNQSLNKLKEQIQENIEKIQLKKDFKYVYVPRWTDRKEFHQIIVSRTMLTDHVPWSILQEFEDAPSGVYLRTTS
ncbi:Alpha/Beta hydrolase protein, partial [Gorgonomyces haynaldii]